MIKAKYELMSYTYFDTKALEFHLQRQAKKGWMLESFGTLFMKYVKTEKRNLKFSVDIFPYIGIFENKNSEQALAYRQVCEDAGWKFLDSNIKMQVFYSEDLDLMPIQTDADIETFAMKKVLLSPEIIVPIIIFGLYFFVLSGNFKFDYKMTLSNMGLAITIITPLLLGGIAFMFFVTLFRYVYTWFGRRKARTVFTKSLVFSNIRRWMTLGYTLIIVVLLLAAVLLDAASGDFKGIIALFPALLGAAIGLTLRSYVFGPTANTKYRKPAIITIGIVIVGLFVFVNTGMLSDLLPTYLEPPKNYVRMINIDGIQADAEMARYNSSLMSPKNYTVTQHNFDDNNIRFLVERYIKTTRYSNNFYRENILREFKDIENNSLIELSAGEYNVDYAYLGIEEFANGEKAYNLILFKAYDIHVISSKKNLSEEIYIEKIVNDLDL